MERLGRLIFQEIWSVKFDTRQLMWVQVQSCGEAAESPSSPLVLVLQYLEWGDLFWAQPFERDTAEDGQCAREEKHGGLQICQWQTVCTSRQVMNLSEPLLPCLSNGAINTCLSKLRKDYILCEHPLEEDFVQSRCSANLGFIFVVPANRGNSILRRVESPVKWRYVVWRRVNWEACWEGCELSARRRSLMSALLELFHLPFWSACEVHTVLLAFYRPGKWGSGKMCLDQGSAASHQPSWSICLPG